jgi:RNA polymerase sigma factor (sigma-70 family)
MSAGADSALTKDGSPVDGTCEPLRSPASLLFRIAIDVANDLGRELVCELPSAEREIQARQDVEWVYRAIEEMPPKCRQVFLLSRVRKMTHPEIARHCGISLKAVEKHISRALAICARKVGGRARGPS